MWMQGVGGCVHVWVGMKLETKLKTTKTKKKGNKTKQNERRA
jgi:hypothetical protein